MRIRNTNDLIGWSFLALFVACFVYYSWRWILGALAFFGFIFIIQAWNRNNRNNHHNNRCDRDRNNRPHGWF